MKFAGKSQILRFIYQKLDLPFIDFASVCAASVTPILLSLSLHRHGYSSMIKFSVVRGPLDVVPMTRLKMDEGSTALHVLADALSCTSVEAEE